MMRGGERFVCQCSIQLDCMDWINDSRDRDKNEQFIRFKYWIFGFLCENQNSTVYSYVFKLIKQRCNMMNHLNV